MLASISQTPNGTKQKLKATHKPVIALRLEQFKNGVSEYDHARDRDIEVQVLESCPRKKLRNKQTDSQTDGLTDTDKQQTDRETNKQAETHKQTEKERERAREKEI
jgi:hypothetical protein